MQSYLKARLSEETLDRLTQSRKQPNRLNTILDLVDKFKKTEPGQEGT